MSNKEHYIPSWAKQIQSELLIIRNSQQVTQQRISRFESLLIQSNSSRSVKRSASTTSTNSTTPAPPSKRRELINKIFAETLPLGPCLNHRLYGPSTRHCLGNCTYVQPKPIIIPQKAPKKIPATTIKKPILPPEEKPFDPSAPWASPESTKSDFLHKMRDSNLSDTSSESEEEDPKTNPKGE